MRSDIVPGGVFPDCALPDHTGTVRTLSELRGSDPMILTLARGHYCPKEHQQHLEMATLLQSKVAQEHTGPDHDPMIPHTLVLKPGLAIHTVHNSYWFWGRPSVYDLWHDLRAASAEIRPDWDLSAPGLREGWTAGDYSYIHGWDRTSDKAPVGL